MARISKVSASFWEQPVAFETFRRVAFALSLAAALGGCAGGVRKYPLKEPLWHDSDRHPFAKQPKEYYSPFIWDASDQTVFRPISRFFAVDPAGESVNVNALDE